MCLDYLRLGVGVCGKPYSPEEARCQVKVLTGTDGKPNGSSKCPHLGIAAECSPPMIRGCCGEAGKI